MMLSILMNNLPPPIHNNNPIPRPPRLIPNGPPNHHITSILPRHPAGPLPRRGTLPRLKEPGYMSRIAEIVPRER